MTVAVPGAGGVIEHQPDAMDDLLDDMVGLEDLDDSDVRVPRLRIIHDEMVFHDTLSGVKYQQLNTIILGVTKQRVYFPPDVDEGQAQKPFCKSPDHEHGFPNVDLSLPTHKQFPWRASVFQDPAWRNPSPEPDKNGHVVLPCGSCNFKEWGQDENGKRKPPPCAEQFSYAILYGGPDEAPTVPAILTLQRSAMAPAKQYNAYFVTQRKLFFSVYTTWSLQQQKRGTVTYCTPVMQRGEATDSRYWNDWADQARTIRTFLRQVPRAGDDGTGQVAGTAEVPSNENVAPAPVAPPAAQVTQAAPAPQAPPPAPAAAAAPPVQAAAPPAPVAPPTPAPVPPPAPVAPAATAPAQAPVTAPETPAPQVTQPPAPVAPPTPPAAPPTPPPAAPPAVAPPAAAPAAPAAAVDSASDLPF